MISSLHNRFTRIPPLMGRLPPRGSRYGNLEKNRRRPRHDRRGGTTGEVPYHETFSRRIRRYSRLNLESSHDDEF